MDTAPTLSSALAGKLAETIDGHTTGDILRFLGLVLIGGVISGTLIHPEFLVRFLTWKDSAIPTVLMVYGLLFKWKSLVDFWKGVMPANVPVTGEVIEDIPTSELLDWLFRHQSLKIKEAKKGFGVSQKRIEALAQHLERVGVLQHDKADNNALKLNPAFSRQDVASIVRGKSKASELESLFRKTDLGYTSEPSADEIQSRLEDVGFTSRILSV